MIELLNSIIRVKNSQGKYDTLSALRGASSYQIAVDNGFQGTEEEWVESIIGDGWIGAFQNLENNKANKTDVYAKSEIGNVHVWRNTESNGTVKYYTSLSKDEYSQYEYLGQIGDRSPRFQFVSYTGTNTGTESNPTSLTFDFAPDIVILIGKQYVSTPSRFVLNYDFLSDNDINVVVMPKELSTEFTESPYGCFTEDVRAFKNYAKKSSDGKTLYWYHESGAEYQCNSSSYIYHFVAIKFE